MRDGRLKPHLPTYSIMNLRPCETEKTPHRSYICVQYPSSRYEKVHQRGEDALVRRMALACFESESFTCQKIDASYALLHPSSLNNRLITETRTLDSTPFCSTFQIGRTDLASTLHSSSGVKGPFLGVNCTLFYYSMALPHRTSFILNHERSNWQGRHFL